ncbi:MAG: pyruvate ferredoxin oxidoreductase, partial [Patescibacteria group bacterium]
PEISKLAVETGFWPMYEIENGVYKINYKPQELKPINEFLALQGRFKHLLKNSNQGIIDDIQKEIHRRWKELNKLESSSN